MKQFDLKLGADVYGREQKLGYLQKVVLNSEATHLTHLVVAQGLLFKRATVLPADLIEAARPEKISLALRSTEDLTTYPPFAEHVEKAGVPLTEALRHRIGEPGLTLPSVDHIPSVGPGTFEEEKVVRQGVEGDAFIWDEETAVYSYQGRVGQLSFVTIDAADGRLLRLIMVRGKLIPTHLIIPLDYVDQANDTNIHVSLENKEIDELSEYVNPVMELANDDKDK